jgi:hypothetical protein
MIERYFVKGARFQWGAPSAISNQPQDGAIVVNPSSPPGSMAYVGLDGEIVDFALPHVTALGLSVNMSIGYSWLSYILGRTAKIATSNDVLTGFMSGRWIATWTDAAGRWVGHIGTIESVGKNEPPNSTVKIEFSTHMPENVQAYNPADAWGFDEITGILSKCKERPAAKILGLVTSANQFYSILFCCRMSEPRVWICGGKKLVTGTAYSELANQLIATRPRR